MTKFLKERLQYLLIALISIGYLSCETDVKLIKEGTETMVVFALLDPDSSVQRIKVNKTFVGEEDANVLAQNAASFNYQPGEINIVLEGYATGSSSPDDSWNVVERKVYPKSPTGRDGEAGIFTTDDNVIYEVSTPVDSTGHPLNTNYSYVLRVTNANTGEVVTARTDLIKADRRILESPKTNLSFANGSGGYLEENIEWTAPAGSRRFEVYMMMYYRETAIGTVDTSSLKTYEIFMGEKKTADRATSSGGQEIALIYNGENFFQRLNEDFEGNTNKILIEYFNFRFVAVGEELNTYVEVNQPSDGIVQEKPEYTNVTDGLGIVSTRRIFISHDLYLDRNLTMKELVLGKYTKGAGLNFCHALRNTNPKSYRCN